MINIGVLSKGEKEKRLVQWRRGAEAGVAKKKRARSRRRRVQRRREEEERCTRCLFMR
jgi:hypothetical protein